MKVGRMIGSNWGVTMDFREAHVRLISIRNRGIGGKGGQCSENAPIARKDGPSGWFYVVGGSRFTRIASRARSVSNATYARTRDLSDNGAWLWADGFGDGGCRRGRRHWSDVRIWGMPAGAHDRRSPIAIGDQSRIDFEGFTLARGRWRCTTIPPRRWQGCHHRHPRDTGSSDGRGVGHVLSPHLCLTVAIVASAAKGIEMGIRIACPRTSWPTRSTSTAQCAGRRVRPDHRDGTGASKAGRHGCRVRACEDDHRARLQQALHAPWLRIYATTDVLGVELAGAAKNVIAIAAGMCDGLGLGDNAKSAVLARGLAEITRLGEAMGAQAETFFGVAGVGDLATTCFSPHGRNRTFGQALGEGELPDAFFSRTGSTVEGLATAQSLAALAQRHDVEMPIAAAIHDVLFADVPVKCAFDELMARDMGREWHRAASQ